MYQHKVAELFFQNFYWYPEIYPYVMVLIPKIILWHDIPALILQSTPGVGARIYVYLTGGYKNHMDTNDCWHLERLGGRQTGKWRIISLEIINICL